MPPPRHFVRALKLRGLLAALVTAGVPHLQAQENNNNGAGAPPPPTYETSHNGAGDPPPRYDAPLSMSPGARPGFSDRLPIWFPLFPPPLGYAIPHHLILPPGRPTPPEIAPFAHEIFFPQLSTRVATHALDARQRTALDAYRADDLALQNQLHAELDRTRDLDPAARRTALAALARVQTPKIAGLEKTAEHFRTALLVSDGSWSAMRRWHLRDGQGAGFSPVEVAKVMRAYAYYADHLQIEQRHLLIETAIELLGATETGGQAAVAQPDLFFSPSPSRVKFSDNLPAALAAKIAAYQSKKARLKKELYDAVTATDGSALLIFHSPLRAAAEKQAPMLAELETIAEDIRRDLALVPPAASSTRRPARAEIDELYRDYHAAVFEPGLSPEQRRLLFTGWLASLDLPLPRSELQPFFREAGR